MKKISVAASRTYDVLIGTDLLEQTGEYAARHLRAGKVCIVTDSTVQSLYGSTVRSSLEVSGFQVFEFAFAPGENSKNMNTITSVLEMLAENEFTRSDALIALGGGIVGDITGFAASIFLRGIEFIQIPTTFLAAVDSSVGGKTGVNLNSGKNLAGAFWQPSLVLCDCNTFKTLPQEIFLDGVAEAVKYGAIMDKSLLESIKALNLSTAPLTSDSSGAHCAAESSMRYENLDIFLLEDITARCVSLKRDLVMEDERDTGLRQLLNFGHTLGHAIEKASGYKISHGHAVAIGMVIVAKASFALNFSQEDCSLPLSQLLTAQGFSLECVYSASQLTSAALKDKKRMGETITVIIPEILGRCVMKKLPISELESFISAGLQKS